MSSRHAEAEAVLARVAWWNGKPAPKLRVTVIAPDQEEQDGGGGEWQEERGGGGGGLKAHAATRIAVRKAGAAELGQGQLLWRLGLPIIGLWFAAAFNYYGLVLIQVRRPPPGTLRSAGRRFDPPLPCAQTDMYAAEESGERCPQYGEAGEEPLGLPGGRRALVEGGDGCGLLTGDDYIDVFISTIGEFPGAPRSRI